MNRMIEFSQLLENVDRSYDGFVHAVITYVLTPGNESKQELIKEFIHNNPSANSSDVLRFMIEETGFFDSSLSEIKDKVC